MRPGPWECDKCLMTHLTTLCFTTPCMGRKPSMFSISSIGMNVKHLNNERSGYGCKLLKKSHHPCDSHMPLEHEHQRAKNLVLSTPLGTVLGMW